MRVSRCLVVPALFVVTAVVAAGCSTTATIEATELAEAIDSPEPLNTNGEESGAPAATAPAATPPVATPTAATTAVPSAPAKDSTQGSETPEAPQEADATEVTPTATGGVESRSAAGVDDIRDVDFENGFTYEDASFGELTATVTNGEYANGELGEDDYFWFAVTGVQYGDLDGDGIEEAVVSTGYSGGGSGFFENVRAFRLVDGAVAEAGIVYFGDRAFGGIADVFIDDGLVSVLMFTDGEGSCCATEAAIVRLVLGEHVLTEADTGQRLTWSSLSQFEERRLLKFLPGTSGAYVSIWGDDLESTFALEAGPGQVLSIEAVAGPAPSEITILDTTTGERIGLEERAVLPSDAIYEVDFAFDDERAEPTTLLVQIDAERQTISWIPRAEQTVVSTDPSVGSSLTWPEFSSETADADALSVANDSVALLARGADDLWVADVTDFPPLPDQESTFELTYEVTYASDDLVSVRFYFYDYVCCRAHPNFGPITEVLDLRAGRPIPVSEILDLGRIDEVQALWIAALESQGELPTELLDDLDSASATFESVGLVAGGLEFGTGRGSLSGGSPGTLVVLTFDELGDLIQPAFRTRLDG